jgi:hypothetical protein
MNQNDLNLRNILKKLASIGYEEVDLKKLADNHQKLIGEFLKKEFFSGKVSFDEFQQIAIIFQNKVAVAKTKKEYDKNLDQLVSLFPKLKEIIFS